MLAGHLVIAGYSRDETEPDESVPPFVCEALKNERLAGLVFFGRNLPAIDPHLFVRTEIERITRGLQKHIHPLFAIDQEGGRVARLRSGVLQLPSMRVLGQAANPSMTELAGEVLGRHLSQLGITMNFAPVLDVDSNVNNPVIGDRSFGRDAQTVITHARAFAAGLIRSGVLPCGKHFPGHGDTNLDSHLALPVLRHDLSRLQRVELAPFSALVDELPAMMSAHVVFEPFGNTPATLNPQVSTKLLRDELGYEGTLISDALEMHALNTFGSLEERAVLAGCDVLLVCHSAEAALSVVDALEREAVKSRVFQQRVEQAVRRSKALRCRSSRPAGALDLSVPKELQIWLDAIMVQPGVDPTESL